MGREQVIAQIDDWENRLKRLYAQIEKWFLELPPVQGQEILKGNVLQHDEPLMREFEVLPRMLPTRAVLYGRNRVSFVPSALWIANANGRVNITTNSGQYVLVDRGGKEGRPSDWAIISSTRRQSPVIFDQNAFESLVVHQALNQAA